MDNGYKRNCRHGKYQHRTVMEAHLGRELLKSEIIHHIDGNKFNNELNNLWLTNHSSHIKAHHTLEKIALQLYRQGFVEFDVTSGEYRLPKK